MALPSPFEPQSETVLGTAILGIDSVEDKSHSQQHDHSRNSARYGAISGSEQYELVINTNDETDKQNEISCSNNRQIRANSNDTDAEEDENHQNHIINSNDKNDKNDEDQEEEEEQNARCTNCNKRLRQLEKENTHQRVDHNIDDDNNNNNLYEEMEEEQEEEEEQEHDQRNQLERCAKETAPQHSVPLLISVTSSANTDTESNTNTNTISNSNSSNVDNTNVLPAHMQLASASSSSLSMFSPLPVIPRFPSLSLMTDSDHSNNLHNINNYNNYCNENINALSCPPHADTHTTLTETQEIGLPALHSASVASSLSLRNSAPESVEHSESIISLRSWRSRMLNLCGLRPRIRHRDLIAASNQSSNSNKTINEENVNRRENRNICSESNSDSSSNNRTSHEQEAVIDTYNVLNGGYVVFTDDYVKAHPNSTISIITSAYKSLKESGSDSSNKEPVNLLEQNVRRSKLQEVRKCIAEVQDLQRPLFKRRNSDLVYGRASYHTRCDGNNNDAGEDKTSTIIVDKNNDKFATDHHIIVHSELGNYNNNKNDEQKQKDENNNVVGNDNCNENAYNSA